MVSRRNLPNLIICGTTGVGKTRLVQELVAKKSSLQSIDINSLAKENGFVIDFDQQNHCNILEDDAIREYLDKNFFEKSPFSSPSGLIFDFHSAGILPDNNRIHGIFVLRTSPDILAQRLRKKNLPSDLQESIIDLERFHHCFNEAQESFHESFVFQLTNDTEDDLKKNLQLISDWIEKWPINTLDD